jgi:FMN-dependent NADH-azoreductase
MISRDSDLTGLIGAFFTPEEKRSAEQKKLLSVSNVYVDELKSADIVVIGAPMYNFGISSKLKAYLDLVARAGIAFIYSLRSRRITHRQKGVYRFRHGGEPPWEVITIL